MDLSISCSINNPQILSSGGVVIPPPLDTYTGAQTAYSIARLLRTAYTGALIRVRRDSDNAELDINATGGVLDEASLLTFTGAGSGYITTAYDQSGNSNDWVQATANKQPRIVDTGTVEKVNGKPAIYSDITAASQDNLRATFAGSATTTTFHVYKTTRDNVILNTSQQSATYSGGHKNGNLTTISANSGTPTTYVNGSTVTDTRDAMYDTCINIHVVAAFTSINFSTWTHFNTDYWHTDGATAPTYIQETIIYDSDKSSDRADIETNINTYYTIY